MIASLRNFLRGTTLLGALLAIAPTAAAPSAARAQTEEARILFERGNEHLARGLRARGRARERELAAALDAYLGVIRLNARTRNVVFNLALTLDELGRDEEAFNYFSEYLHGFELGEDERAEGRRRLEALRPSVAVVRVESTPPGAEVRLDRRDLPVRGTTPIELAVSPGTHLVFVTRRGYAEGTATTSAAIGSTAHVALELVPEPIDVQVIAPSSGALTLDGEAIEPGRTLRVPPGPHVVRLEIAGAPPIEPRFELAPGDAPLVLELSGPATAAASSPRLAVTIDTPAQVFVDGLSVGRGDRVEIPVLPGAHELRVTAPGHTPLVHRVSLEPGETLRLSVDLGVAPDATGVDVARGVLGALTAAGIAVSIGLYVHAQELWDLWNRAIRDQDAWSAEALHRLADRVEAAALATDVSVGITAALGLAAIVSFFVGPGAAEDSSVRVAAAPLPNGASASVAWRAW